MVCPGVPSPTPCSGGVRSHRSQGLRAPQWGRRGLSGCGPGGLVLLVWARREAP